MAQRVAQLASEPVKRGEGNRSEDLTAWEVLLEGRVRGLETDSLLSLVLAGSTRAASLSGFFLLLSDLGSVGRLTSVSAAQLASYGVAPGDRARVLAMAELARRIAFTEVPQRTALTSSTRFARYLAHRYGRFDQEVLGVAYLDVKHQLIALREVARGSLTGCVIPLQLVLQQGLFLSASGLLLFHTHTSGDPEPSAADRKLTAELAEACRTVGLELVDHLVLGSPSRFFSFRDQGQLPGLAQAA